MIRTASLNDIEEILPIYAAIRPSLGKTYLEREVQTKLTDDYHRCRIIEVDRSIVGFSASMLTLEGELLVSCVAVSKNARGKGFGSELMVDIHELREEIGTPKIILYPPESAVPFYRSLGYSCDDQDPGLFYLTA